MGYVASPARMLPIGRHAAEMEVITREPGGVKNLFPSLSGGLPLEFLARTLCNHEHGVRLSNGSLG